MSKEDRLNRAGKKLNEQAREGINEMFERSERGGPVGFSGIQDIVTQGNTILIADNPQKGIVGGILRESTMDPINQCGIAPLNTGPNDPMIDACKFHDACYVANKENDEGVRRFCDDTFLKLMRKIKGMRTNTYYYLARAFGWIPWYFGRAKK